MEMEMHKEQINRVKSMGKLDGKVALVGGNLGKMKKKDDQEVFAIGLGGVIAKTFVAEGAQVIVVDLEFKIAEECAKSIGGSIKAMNCDILKDRAYEMKDMPDEKNPGAMKKELSWIDNPSLKLVNDIVAEFGKLDILITNFDYFDSGRIENNSEEFYNKMRDQNIWPTFHLLAAVRDQFASQNKTNGTYAKVVMITNMVGKAGMSLGALYSAFKASIIGLNKGLAREFGRFANVNTVAYGPFTDKNLQGPRDRVKKAFMVTSSDMANQDITPEKVAPMVLLLASDDGMGIAGQTISIDGGLWLKLEQ
jgi:NAD(P)-dependent dehydrogenase (short-subunit alcohol dehydrogenase family)